VIIDTDILIDLDKKYAPAEAWLQSLPTLPPVCGIAALELKQGCQNRTELTRVENLLLPFAIVWPREADMQYALVTLAPLRLTRGLGLLDSLIAATALGLGEPLATFNRKHFEAVPGLTTVQPYTR
jgi:predicted nucleic acid-binding protein